GVRGAARQRRHRRDALVQPRVGGAEEMNKNMETRTKRFRLAGAGLALLGVLSLAAPLAAHAEDDPDAAVFRTGLGMTFLKFVDRTPTTLKHDFAIVDFGVSKSFGSFFVGFDTELPFNQGGTPNNNEFVQTEVADLTVGYAFFNKLSVFTGAHY